MQGDGPDLPGRCGTGKERRKSRRKSGRKSRGTSRGANRRRDDCQKNMAMSLAGMGLSAEKIAEAAKVSVQLVQEWLMGKTDLAK